MTGAFPGVGWDRLAWIAFIPLFFATAGVSGFTAFQIGFTAGLAHYLTLMYWLVGTMGTYGYLPLYLSVGVLFLLCAYLALFPAVFCVMLTPFQDRPALHWHMIPVAWTALEYLRSFLLSGFPWSLMGYSQFTRLNLIQISDILGVYGVSFLILMGNGTLYRLCRYALDKKTGEHQTSGGTAGLTAGVFLVLLSMTWLYGRQTTAETARQVAAAPSIEVMTVQGNIDQAHKWDPQYQASTVEKYIRLSRSGKDRRVDLTVWPETALPFYFLDDVRLTNAVLDAVRAADTAFLFGSPSYKRTRDGVAYYNSAYLVEPDGGVAGKYDKVHLVPFGEYVPLKRWLPFLGKMVAQVGDFKTGEKGATLSLGSLRIGVQICYEIIFPDLSREMARNGAAILVNITNDAWFGRTSAPYQHFSMAAFRAAENKRALIRCANTGVSGLIGPAGRIWASTGLFEESVLTGTVPILDNTTLYTRYGDVFAGVCLGAALVLTIINIFARRKRK